MGMILSNRKPPKGSSAAALRKWAVIFLLVGIVGRSVFLNGMLGLDSLRIDAAQNEQLSALLETNGDAGMALTAVVLCCFAETCAIPLFAFLLIEGVRHTASLEKYLLRLIGFALVCELPFNLATSGELLDLGSRNPAFGLVVCFLMLFFFRNYGEKSLKNTLMKTVIFVAAFLWTMMLSIEFGYALAIFTGMLWLAREKSNFRAMYAFGAAMICTMIPNENQFFFIGACLSSIMLHRYTEELGEQNRILNYAVYPVCLLILGIAAKFI